MKTTSAYLFRPQRELYYIPASQQDIDYFYQGILPESLKSLDGSFGTYDCPGLFMLKNGTEQIKVLGIEYRPNDSRIAYPVGFEKMVLDAAVMTTDTFWDEISLDEQMVNDFVYSGEIRVAFNPFNGGQTVSRKNPDIVQVYNKKGHNRILILADCQDAKILAQDNVIVTANEKVLFEKAYMDSITNHYNWNYIWPIISDYGKMGIQDFSFVHFDVKDFKAINLIYGHDLANSVLRNIVKQMKKMDWVYHSARCDNDNFAMMIKDMPEEETREKLTAFFEEISYFDPDPSYRVHYRCGVVPMRSTLLLGNRVADAGKQAQRRGNKLYETEITFFTDEMRDEQEWSIRIRTYLDTAIKNDEFLIYLQPQFDILTDHIRGAEALIRWNYKGEMFLSPGRFVPIFETGGLISKLDDIVLHKVCQTMIRWKEEGRCLIPVSVNVSRKSIGIPGLVEHLEGIVDSYGIDHSLIDFELTESASYENHEYMINVIRNFKSKGFRISMDDFGTGYSSLSLLTTMPIDTIKIDKSFVDGIRSVEGSEKSQAVIRLIISLSKELKFTCLAEGVENIDQLAKLREYGCEILQGYYYSKPVSVEEFESKFMNS